MSIRCPKRIGAQEYAAVKSSCLSQSLRLKTSHQYFYQIQVAMHVCQRQLCDFFVSSPDFIVLNRVFRDDYLFYDVLAKLLSFFPHLLPALSAESLVGADEGVESEVV